MSRGAFKRDWFERERFERERRFRNVLSVLEGIGLNRNVLSGDILSGSVESRIFLCGNVLNGTLLSGSTVSGSVLCGNVLNGNRRASGSTVSGSSSNRRGISAGFFLARI